MTHNPKRICMLADSHGLYDDRIYWKEAVSLSRSGYEVHYVLAADMDEEWNYRAKEFIISKSKGKLI